MIPQTETVLNADIVFVEQPSHTFYLNTDEKTVVGFTDGREAMKQAIYLILSIERYKWVVLSWNSGVELEDLYGMPISFIIPEVERRIVEALAQDSRITSVDGFDFVVGKGKLSATFTVHTVFGDIPSETAVNLNV